MNNIDVNDLISVNDAAKLCDVTVQAVYDWIDADKLKVYSLSNIKFLDRKEVQELKIKRGNGK